MTMTDEEVGRVAVSLPGWRWMAGMLVVDTSSNPAYRLAGRAWDESGVVSDDGDGLNLECIIPAEWPDPDDPATGGALLALMGDDVWRVQKGHHHDDWRHHVENAGICDDDWGPPMTLGRACIAAAEALGRWPGGES